MDCVRNKRPCSRFVGGLLFKHSLPVFVSFFLFRYLQNVGSTWYTGGHLPRTRDTYVSIVNAGDGGRGDSRIDATSSSPKNVPKEIEEAPESWSVNSGDGSRWRVSLLRGWCSVGRCWWVSLPCGVWVVVGRPSRNRCEHSYICLLPCADSWGSQPSAGEEVPLKSFSAHVTEIKNARRGLPFLFVY